MFWRCAPGFGFFIQQFLRVIALSDLKFPSARLMSATSTSFLRFFADLFLLCEDVHLGPVVESIISLTNLLVVKILTVLVSTISNSQVFLLKKNVSTGVPVYLAPWAACPPGVKIPQGILPPPWAACPPGVKLPLGSLPPGGEDTLAWAACPPPQENLTELNAGRFYVFKIKILIIETWENWFLHVCAYASFSWYEEIEGQNIVALEVCTYARKPGRLHSKR